jgi:G3E family GTPase
MVPACLITGLPGADKQGFIAALAAARPHGARWALLDNDGGGSAQALTRKGFTAEVVIGCACCTGQVTLQVGLVRLLRRSHPDFLLIAADSTAEPDALEQALRQPELAKSIAVTRRVCVAPPQWLAALPEAARERLRRQIAAADSVVAASADGMQKLRAAGYLRASGFAETIHHLVTGVSA